MTREEILREIRESPAQKVKVAVTDVDGILRGKIIHKDKFLAAVDGGFGFCNVIFGWDMADVCYDNGQYTGWHTGYPDTNARIDLNTYRHIPWDDHIPMFLGDFDDGVCPRQLLKTVIARAKNMGLSPSFGVEFEWFNFKETPHTLAAKRYVQPEPLTPGMFGYSILRSSYNQPYFAALMDELLAFGIPIEGLHTETGPGVFEAAILHCEPLEAADRAVLFKTAAKEIGYRFGILPSFMAKWNATLPGCGGHLHQSLIDHEGNNVFYDAQDPHRMSATFKHYVAGQVALLPELLPLLCPNVNSYKRLVEGA